MSNWLAREELVIGPKNIGILSQKRIAVLGLGGVGSAAAEALCRAGVGNLLLVDHDTVDITNLNRQLLATTKTIGQLKTEVMLERLLSINPNCRIETADSFYLPENRSFLFDYKPDYILDAIDTMTAKIDLVKESKSRDLPLLCCLGTGNRTRPELLAIGDLADTAGCGCPVARIMRRELKKHGITRQSVIYSLEYPQKAIDESGSNGKHPPGSISFVPPVAGYLMASQAVRDILEM